MFFQSVISNRTSMSLQIGSSKTIFLFPIHLDRRFVLEDFTSFNSEKNENYC